MFKPTYLYIKQHSVTKKLYFGKTSREDPEKYRGSGKYWKAHIKKHGVEHVETLWYCLFIEGESCKEFASMFSEQESIATSKAWLNLIPETGVNGPTRNFTDEWKVNISLGKKGVPAKNKGVVYSAEIRKRMSDAHKGKPLSESHIRNAAEARRGKLHTIGKVECPHCGVIGGKNNMKMWHFDNCLTIVDKRSKKGNISFKQTTSICPHCGLVGGASNMARYHFDNCKGKKK
jgi:hypothetical protein